MPASILLPNFISAFLRKNQVLQESNWNNRSCKSKVLSWQIEGMLSKNFAKFFGQVLRKHRKARFLSQEELAERADLASKMVSLIERFERNPTLNVADSIAQAMDVPLWRLIKDTEDLRKEKTLPKEKA